MPGRWHQHTLQRPNVRLYRFVDDHGLGWVLLPGLEIPLADLFG
jgi:hypothetical protein